MRMGSHHSPHLSQIILLSISSKMEVLKSKRVPFWCNLVLLTRGGNLEGRAGGLGLLYVLCVLLTMTGGPLSMKKNNQAIYQQVALLLQLWHTPATLGAPYTICCAWTQKCWFAIVALFFSLLRNTTKQDSEVKTPYKKERKLQGLQEAIQ